MNEPQQNFDEFFDEQMAKLSLRMLPVQKEMIKLICMMFQVRGEKNGYAEATKKHLEQIAKI